MKSAARATVVVAVAALAPSPAAVAEPPKAERGARIAAMSVYLDERLVDLSREVLVTVDGKERFKGVPALSLVTLVRSGEEREDPEYAFAAEAVWPGEK